VTDKTIEALREELARANREIERLNEEMDDLNILYEATIEHGEAVEDQLAENNILLTQTQARLDEELRDATSYVMSTIPDPRQAAPAIDWLLVPSTELGGDSFGYHEIDDDHMALYLLDVCGHGVGAALLSVTAINVLRSSALPNTDFRDPSAVMAALNEAFPMEKQNNMYFTIWFGVLKRSTGELRYSSGGHPPAVLLRGEDGSAEQLTTGGIALGTFPGLQYDTGSCVLRAGDSLLVFSDGAFEVETGPGEMLPFADFVEFLRQPGGDAPHKVLDWIQGLNGEGPLPDDFSFMRIRV
jgi:sigma-B regulation protein RsbU (phosphoserine phosphatase)